jgi:hypothetical protein
MKKLVIFSDFPILPTKGYQEFFNKLFNSGKVKLADVNNPLSATMSLSFNHRNEHLQAIINAGIPIKDRHLVLSECPQILPEMHQKSTLENYGKIYSASPEWAKEYSPYVFKFGFHLEVEVTPNPLHNRKYKFGLIQRNKYSCIKGELYSLRREVVIGCAKNNLPLVLRGSGWNKSLTRVFFEYLKILRFYSSRVPFSDLKIVPKSNMTKNRFESFPINDKQEFLREVCVAVVIENASNYVSEKIFDCFRAGTVPIYVGPDFELYGIPENTVIRAKADANSIIEIMKKIDQYDLSRIQKNGWNFLVNGGEHWSDVLVMKNLVDQVINEI